MNKYEQLIEHIINDEEDQARALFHEIVVEKSRDIYESLMDEEYSQDGLGGSPVNQMVDEIAMDETDGIGEGDDNLEMDMDDMSPMGNMDGMEPEMGDEGDLEQKVMDLEAELEAIKAEFEVLRGDDEGDMDMEPKMGDIGDKEDEEEEEDEESMMEEETSESVYESTQRRPLQKTAVDLMREYVETISKQNNTEGQPAGTSTGGDRASVNTQSIVAGKNDMGGTAKNLAQGSNESAPDGTSAPKKGTTKDLPGAGKFENVPGAKAGKSFSNKEKATTGEEGSINKHSIEPGGN